MTKADFQKLADMRIKEAEILLAAGEFDGAYYLSGYAIECALKACIIRMLNTSDSWRDRSFSEKCWRHDLEPLMKLGGLEADLNTAGPVAINWAVVKDWTEQSRYEIGKLERDVKQFYEAIIHPTDGVLQWLKARW